MFFQIHGYQLFKKWSILLINLSIARNERITGSGQYPKLRERNNLLCAWIEHTPVQKICNRLPYLKTFI